MDFFGMFSCCGPAENDKVNRDVLYNTKAEKGKKLSVKD